VDDPRRRRPDITLAKALLDWAPRVPLKTGLTRTVAWFSKSLRAARQSADAALGKARPGDLRASDPASLAGT
jgi:dTDP-D-glucose 4,6-dehydratase